MRARSLLFAIVCCVELSCVQPEPFKRLDYPVVDAAYSQSLKLVVMASAGPPALHLYDPISRSEQVVALSADPTCVATSRDGRFAAVGHDQLISYVDLSTASVVSTYPIADRVYDIMVAENGFVYGFPYDGRTIEINVSNGGVRRGVSDWGWSAQQRPGTHSVYAAIGGGNLRKFDISGGAILAGYFAPYWYPQEHPFCSKVWISDDGKRIFTGCGHTFRASSNTDQDMQYVGSLAGLAGIQALSDSSAADHVVVIPTADDSLSDTQLRLYHRAYLEYRGSKPLPSFAEGGSKFPAHGRFVFFDESGDYFVTILQADQAAGLQHEFAVFVANFDPSDFCGSTGPTPPTQPLQAFSTFDHAIEDAEYDAVRDRIVYVSSDPNTLHIIDPESNSDEFVPLPFSPTSVSIAPGGERAAVGHDRSISFVDLQSASLLANYPLLEGTLDTVLTDDWAYLLPRGRGSANLSEIQLTTGVWQRDFQNSITGDARAKLDVSGSRLYVANNHVFPSGLTIFDISMHPARYLRGVTIPTNPSVCGDLWVSEDGGEIFTRCGAVLRASNVTVQAQLAGLASVRHLSDSAEAKTIAAIPGVRNFDGYGFADSYGESRVELFDSESYSFERSIDLPDFVLGDTSHPSRGSFVFFNRLGTRIYVILEADPAAGLTDGFGLVSFDVP